MSCATSGSRPTARWPFRRPGQAPHPDRPAARRGRPPGLGARSTLPPGCGAAEGARQERPAARRPPERARARRSWRRCRGSATRTDHRRAVAVVAISAPTSAGSTPSCRPTCRPGGCTICGGPRPPACARLGVDPVDREGPEPHLSGSFGGVAGVYQRHDFAGAEAPGPSLSGGAMSPRLPRSPRLSPRPW